LKQYSFAPAAHPMGAFDRGGKPATIMDAFLER
jgi:hypothetical protein